MEYLGEILEDENGELMLTLPVHLMNQMGWDFGTELEWIVDDGKVILREAEGKDDV